MPISFPSSPTVNQTYTYQGHTWTWNGTTWDSTGTATVTGPTGPTGPAGTYYYQATAPTNVAVGTSWINTNDGRVYSYSGSQWFEPYGDLPGATGPTGPTGATGPNGSPTRAINSQSSNYTLQTSDANQAVVFTGSSSQTLTVNNVLTTGQSTSVYQDGTGQVFFSAGTGVTLTSPGMLLARTQYSNVLVNCIASGQYRLSGDVAIMSGGVVYSDATYYYRTFTVGGTFVSPIALTVDILMVGGGGSGGAMAATSGQTNRGAGGGAGGLIYLSSYSLPASTYTITVGAGGASLSGTVAAKGSDTVITNGVRTITAYGGGSGGYNDTTNNATAGGSGAGQWYPGYSGSAATQPSTTNDGVSTYAGTGFGNAGGTSGNTQPYASGGGGAGAAGANYNASGGPVGGVGKQYSAFATATSTGANGGYYAGGGGGAGYPSDANYAGYAGGLGGGGTGSNNSYNTASNAVANTGGGGGSGGSGGSGVVIIRYTRSQVGG
jgi:hypothetical protein